VIWIVTKIELVGSWSMPYPLKKLCQNPFATFSVSDGQTGRQTDRSENITSFVGGNYRKNIFPRILGQMLSASPTPMLQASNNNEDSMLRIRLLVFVFADVDCGNC